MACCCTHSWLQDRLGFVLVLKAGVFRLLGIFYAAMESIIRLYRQMMTCLARDR